MSLGDNGIDSRAIHAKYRPDIYLGERLLAFDEAVVPQLLADRQMGFPSIESRIPGLNCVHSLAPYLKSRGGHRFSTALLEYRSVATTRALGRARPCLQAFASMLTFALTNIEVFSGYSALVPVPHKLDQVPESYHLYDLLEAVRLLDCARKWIVCRDLLRFKRSVASLKETALHLRRTSIAGAMCANSSRGINDVVLIDDIIATGATLTEASRALREGGVTRIVALSLAKRVA